MSNESSKDNLSVSAEDNSIAVGNLSVGGSVDGSIVIGSNNIVGFSSEQVAALIEKIKTGFQPKPFDGQCPYKGLDVFEEEDAELFFGREKLVEELVRRVNESRTVFITGPSGSGKSSLIRAGLIHTLRQGSIQELHSERWLYSIMKPGRDPVDALANALSRLKSPEVGKYLRQNAGQAGALNECVESVLTDQKNQRLILFIDQFEEVFTQVNKETDRVSFLNLLTHATSKEDGRIAILFAMRSDFIPNCATYPQLNDLLNKQFIQVGPMQPDELVSAIAQPALRVGLPIEPDLIVQVINEMQGQTGALPLMQFALKDLFDSQKEKGGVISLTLSDYLKRGGMHKALERHADMSIGVLDENEKELARSIFSALIEVGRGTQDTRRTAMFGELVSADGQTEAAQSIVRKLADARLVTTDEQTVTISHEKLIDAWPWLKKLVNENRDVIALQNEIAEHAREWDEHQRDESYLYSGVRLANAQEKLESKKLALGGLAQLFVITSTGIEKGKRHAEEKRRQRELDDAKKLAETAQAQAKAERRALVVTRGILGLVFILAIVLGYTPVKNEFLRQRALKADAASFQKGDYLLGDSLAKDAPDEYLAPGTYPISSFSIDTFPVTNQRYNLCIQAGGCSRPNDFPDVYEATENNDKPVVNVNAIDASEYCQWLDMRLPTDKEWELAAAKGKIELPDSEPDTVSFFYEWTSSSYFQNTPGSADTLNSLPDWLTKKGGLLGQPLSQIMTYRQGTSSISSDETTGFRCAKNNF